MTGTQKDREQPVTHDSEGGEGAKWQLQSDEMWKTSRRGRGGDHQRSRGGGEQRVTRGRELENKKSSRNSSGEAGRLSAETHVHRLHDQTGEQLIH